MSNSFKRRIYFIKQAWEEKICQIEKKTGGNAKVDDFDY